MGSRLQHTDRIARIEIRVDRLGERATHLLELEQATMLKLEDLTRALRAPGRGLRRARLARALRRTELRLAELRDQRRRLAEDEMRSVMLALERQSRRTRKRLDRKLERLTPVHEEWVRLGEVFDSLDQTVAIPALKHLAGHWRGSLEIPEFPIAEQQGYPRPFPSSAVLF